MQSTLFQGMQCRVTDLSCCGDGGALGLANGLGGLVLVYYAGEMFEMGMFDWVFFSRLSLWTLEFGCRVGYVDRVFDYARGSWLLCTSVSIDISSTRNIRQPVATLCRHQHCTDNSRSTPTPHQPPCGIVSVHSDHRHAVFSGKNRSRAKG